MGRRALVLVLIGMGLLAANTKAQAQAYGSFVESCTEIEQRGPYLRALCRDVYGRYVPSQLDLRYCPSGQAANRNGRLACEGGSRRSYRRYDDEDYGYRGYDRYDRPAPRGYYTPY